MSKKSKSSSTKKFKKNPAKVSKPAKPVKAVDKKASPKKSLPAKKSKGKAAAKPVKQKAAVAKPTKKTSVKKVIKKVLKAVAKKIKGKPLNTKIKKAKTPVAKPAKKAVKPVSAKAPVTSKKAAPAVKDRKGSEIIKNPVHLKKDNSPIPEFKPVIQPTVKAESSTPKETFATALKGASASASILTNAAKKTEAYSVKAEKEPPGKFEMEFVIRASAELLYEFLITPSGLSEWFCDDVNIRNGIYTFIWDGQLQQARLLKTVDEQLVRYQWVDKADGSYFEFRIQRDELTNDISLIITDFAGDKGEQESSKLLWASQIDKLLHVMGSYF